MVRKYIQTKRFIGLPFSTGVKFHLLGCYLYLFSRLLLATERHLYQSVHSRHENMKKKRQVKGKAFFTNVVFMLIPHSN